MKTPVLKSLLKIEKGLRSMRFPVNLPIFKDSLFCRPPQGDGSGFYSPLRIRRYWKNDTKLHTM